MNSHLETAVEIAREAGALLVTYFERRVPFELKGEFDLVTEADRASEKLVVERLQSRFPQHGIVAEEGGGHTSPSEYRWYVDPLGRGRRRPYQPIGIPLVRGPVGRHYQLRAFPSHLQCNAGAGAGWRDGGWSGIRSDPAGDVHRGARFGCLA